MTTLQQKSDHCKGIHSYKGKGPRLHYYREGDDQFEYCEFCGDVEQERRANLKELHMESSRGTCQSQIVQSITAL